MSREEKAAKIIRVITVPPILVIFMLSVLYVINPSIFLSVRDYLIAVLFLGICPALAYPLQEILPKWKDKGREGQRALAFICTVFGYLCAFGYSCVVHISKELEVIFLNYLIAVLMLSVLNKLFHIRASGHACSITAPFLYLLCWGSLKWALACMVIGMMSFWASIKLKRHLLSDLIYGSIVSVTSFGIACLIMQVCYNMS